MTKYIYTDVQTNEQFYVFCEKYEIHNLELKNENLKKWCEGRIISRLEY